MRKFNRIPLSVEAVQYFPYLEINLPGFRNLVEELLEQSTMLPVKIVRKAIISQDFPDGKTKDIEIFPGDWIVKFPDGKVTVRKNMDFDKDFIAEF